ncbi:MAG: hypothetical protein ABR582_05380 [Gemmatimonadaceae bacterium]
MKSIALLALVSLGCATSTPVQQAGAPPSTGLPASVVGSETVEIRLAADADDINAVIKAPSEKVWALLPEVYKTIGIVGAEVLDSDAEIFGTHNFTSRKLTDMRTAEIVRCGNDVAGPSGGMYRTKLSIATTVQPKIDGTTAISTLIEGYATPAEGTSTDAVRCVSNGKLEKRIRNLLNEKLKG